MITKKDIDRVYTRVRAKECSMSRAIADLVAEHIDVICINEAVSTHSVYIQVKGKGEVRISDHSKYGMRNPLHIHNWSSRQDLADRLNRLIERVK